MNTHYRVVSVKDELPKDQSDIYAIGSNNRIYHCMYDAEFDEYYELPATDCCISDKITHWLQPIPTLSREEMIKIASRELLAHLNNTAKQPRPFLTITEENKVSLIIDAILSAGLPVKEVEIRKDIHKNMCPYCKSIVDGWDKYCHECGSEINWIN